MSTKLKISLSIALMYAIMIGLAFASSTVVEKVIK